MVPPPPSKADFMKAAGEDKKVSYEELKKAIGMSEETANAVGLGAFFTAADSSGDGLITWDECMAFFATHSGGPQGPPKIEAPSKEDFMSAAGKD